MFRLFTSIAFAIIHSHLSLISRFEPAVMTNVSLIMTENKKEQLTQLLIGLFFFYSVISLTDLCSTQIHEQKEGFIDAQKV